MKISGWSELYSVYHPELDKHHRKLFEYFMLLDQAIAKGSVSHQFLAEIVKGLSDYTDYHFTLEEELMRRYGYPYYDEHKQLHEQFVHDVDVFRQECASGSDRLLQSIKNYLERWLVEHILTADKKYASYFKKRGIEVD